ncbi:MAG: hypothetical protein GEU80_09610 [Dehalococcoidia bacterium]|nr:hypothetical protein [Dehalococcoidia bacterium]
MPAPPVEQWRERTDAQPLNRALGLRAEEIAEGFTRYRVVRVPGSAAGIDGNEAPEGVSTFAITTAADLALVSAVSTTVQSGRDVMNGTAEMNLTYVAQPLGEAVVTATVVHRGALLAVVDVRVEDDEGAPIAYGRGSYAIRPADGAPR